MIQTKQLSNSKKLQAAQKAIRTDRWTETMFRALTAKVASRWKFVSFRGPNNRESAGIVDILAVRRNTKTKGVPPLKSNDFFDFALVQLKGGSAPMPSLDDMRRLWAVKAAYNAKEVVLFQWSLKNKTKYSVLTQTPVGELAWTPSTRHKTFG